MKEHSRNVAIGAFIFGALLIAGSLAIFLVGTGIGQDNERVVMVFDGSVKGLSIGAPVSLRGVEIGQVTNIQVTLDTKNMELIMTVEADIDPDNVMLRGRRTNTIIRDLINHGLRAQLNPQSLLTGLLFVQLDFHPGSPLILADINSPYDQIPTIPTELQRFSQEVENLDLAQLANDIRDIASGMKSLIANDSFQAIPANLDTTMKSVTELAHEMRSTINQLRPGLNTALNDAARALETINREIPRLSNTVDANLNAVGKAANTFEKTLADVDNVVSPDSTTIYELHKALRELTLASRAMQLLAKTLDEQPEALLRGKREDSP